MVDTTTDGAADSIDEISHTYLGRSCPSFRGVPETRLLMTITADSVLPPAPD